MDILESLPELPAVAFIGGIHGIERIGTQVVLAFLHTRWRPPADERQRLFESGVAYWYKPPRSVAAGTD